MDEGEVADGAFVDSDVLVVGDFGEEMEELGLVAAVGVDAVGGVAEEVLD